MKQYTLAEMEDKHIGLKGTKERNEYEYKLGMELLRRALKPQRKNKI